MNSSLLNIAIYLPVLYLKITRIFILLFDIVTWLELSRQASGHSIVLACAFFQSLVPGTLVKDECCLHTVVYEWLAYSKNCVFN